MTGATGIQIPQACLEDLKPGELVARYTYAGMHGHGTFNVSVVIGRLSTANLNYDDEQAGFAVSIDRAATIATNTERYDSLRDGTHRAIHTRRGTSFSYAREMLLRNITAPANVQDTVSALCSSTRLIAAGGNWQKSVIGMDGIAAMQRSLFVATGALELDTLSELPRRLTDPEVRADILNLAAATALYAYMNMPLRLAS